MSLTGSIVIVVVLIARLAMRRLPKKYFYLLWGIVGFRLLCPISLESSFSIFNIRPIRNSVETIKDLPLVQYGTGHASEVTSTVTKVQQAGTGVVSNHMITPYVLLAVWAVVAVGIICYITFKYAAIKRDLKNTTQVGPRLYMGHQVDSPFVMGIVKPKIYMPTGLTDSELEYLTLHERTHIRRGDTFFKALGLLALTIHWFNPLVWLAYALFVRDMEMSCDEEVIAKLGNDVKADYSMSLVSFARKSDNSKYIVVPVAFSKVIFGRKDVKMRIKNVLGYHGTSKLLSTVALALVASISLICLFNASSRADITDEPEETTAVSETENQDGEELDVTNQDEQATTDESESLTEHQEEEVELGDSVDTNAELQVTDPADDQEPSLDEVNLSLADDESGEANLDCNVTDVYTSSKIHYIVNKENILNTELPLFDDQRLAVDVVLNLPKGTKADDNKDLSRFLQTGVALESDTFSVYYKKTVTVRDFTAMVSVLSDKYGFDTDSFYSQPACDGGCQSCLFVGTNASTGITVTMEQIAGETLRISYYKTVDSGNSFGRVG